MNSPIFCRLNGFNTRQNISMHKLYETVRLIIDADLYSIIILHELLGDESNIDQDETSPRPESTFNFYKNE